MRVTAEATEIVTDLDGVPVRVWKARTESGVEFTMFVHRVAVHEGQDQAEFERELRAMPEPRVLRAREVFDPRLLS